jgi:hypothetical protein
VQSDKAKAERNMRLAENEEQYRAMASVFEVLRQQKTELRAQISGLESDEMSESEPKKEIAAILAELDRLPDLAADPEDLAGIGQAFRTANLRLFFAFDKRQVNKRLLNRIARGIVAFGDEPPPTKLYEGPTGRRTIKLIKAATSAANPGGGVPLLDRFGSGREGNSLGNVNRGDKI